MSNGVTTVGLDDLIEAVFTNSRIDGKRVNSARLYREVTRYAQVIIRARALHLAEHQHDDVIQAAFEGLWRAGLGGLRGKAAFRLHLKQALRTVQAASAAPGMRTRTYSKPRTSKRARVAAEHIGQLMSADALTAAATIIEGREWQDLGRVVDPVSSAAAEEADYHADMRKMLATAPPVVVQALRLINEDELDKQAAALALGMSRHALNRRLGAFYESLSWAA